MPFADLLTQSATVERFALSTADRYGRASEKWVAASTPEPCRLSGGLRRGGSLAGEPTVAAQADASLFLQAGAAISMRDRVVVSGRRYSVLWARTVRGLASDHHVEAGLLEVVP